jgi:hypothetical protein
MSFMVEANNLLKSGIEFLRPSLEKISLAFFLLFIVFLSLLVEIPEWIYLPIMYLLAWPLLGLAQLCGPTDVECQNAMSFVGLIFSLLYWYLASCFISWALEKPEEEEE